MQLLSLNKISKFQLYPSTMATALVCWLSSYSMGLLIVFSPSPLKYCMGFHPPALFIPYLPIFFLSWAPHKGPIICSQSNRFESPKNVILQLSELLDNTPDYVSVKAIILLPPLHYNIFRVLNIGWTLFGFNQVQIQFLSFSAKFVITKSNIYKSLRILRYYSTFVHRSLLWSCFDFY